MCFSAGASFTAGVMLSIVGTETYRKVHKPRQLVLASIPLFFAVQQFAEGVVWLTIGKPDHAVTQAVASYIFLIFAQVVWPVMVPLSVLILEKNKNMKRILSVLLALGIAVALYYTYGLIFIRDVNAQIIGLHIVYRDTTYDIQGAVVVLLYIASAIAPMFVSTIKKIHFVGIIMSIALIVSGIFYIQCLTSVWCFFAAIISFVVFYIVSDAHKLFHLERLNLKLVNKI